MTGPLSDRDVERVFGLVVPSWELERLDTRLGTAEVAKQLRSRHGTVGGVTGVEDGPYAGPERFSLWYDCDGRRGVDVRIERHAGEEREVLRAGRVSWNRLANMATIEALRRRAPRPGDQLSLLDEQ